MSEDLLHLVEYTVQIAWDYLERTGQIDDESFTSRFLLKNFGDKNRQGERRPLLLSNRAIKAYERLRQGQKAA